MKLSLLTAIAVAVLWTGTANAAVMGSAATSISQASVVQTVGWKHHHRHKKCWRSHGHMKCRWM